MTHTFFTWTHSPINNGAKSLCIFQCGQRWRVSSCNAGSETVALQVVLKQEGLL